MNLDTQIEALLYWKGEPMKIKTLAEILEVSESEIQAGVATLVEKLKNRGLQLITLDNTVMIGTRAEFSPLIEKVAKEELARDIGKAGLETLTIILYRGPVGRRDIDYIRGVNSNFIIRNLLVRGLIEKIENPSDQRSFLYKPSLDLLRYLGISKVEDLPEFGSIQTTLKQYKHDEEKTHENQGDTTG